MNNVENNILWSSLKSIQIIHKKYDFIHSYTHYLSFQFLVPRHSEVLWGYVLTISQYRIMHDNDRVRNRSDSSSLLFLKDNLWDVPCEYCEKDNCHNSDVTWAWLCLKRSLVTQMLYRLTKMKHDSSTLLALYGETTIASRIHHKGLTWKAFPYHDMAISSQIARFMGPIWSPPGSCRPQVGPMLALKTLLSGMLLPDCTFFFTGTTCTGFG